MAIAAEAFKDLGDRERQLGSCSGGTVKARSSGLRVSSGSPPYDYGTLYWYDSRGRLNRLSGPGTPWNYVNYLYLADSDLVEKIEYRGPALEEGYSFIASVIRTFEPNRDLITSVENKWDSTTVSKFEYTNDALGRRSSVTVSGSAFNATGTTGFDLFTCTLDTPQVLRTQDRLRRASRPRQADRNELATAKRYTGGTLENPTDPVYSRHFVYDYDPTLDMPRTLRVPERLRCAARQGQVGNRESYLIGQGTATTYTANALNQYTATADPSESFTHDDDGNLTQDGTYTYVWDAENRLIEIRPTSPGTNAIKFVYDYDYMGRRARRTQYGWTGSAWSTSIADQRIYLYDRWNNLIIYDADNGMAIGRKLTWGLDLSGLNGGAAPSPVDPNRDREGAVIPGMHAAGGIGGLLAAWAPASPAKQYFCFYDANGNLSDCLKNSDGTRWSHYEYDPYGGQIVAGDPGSLSHQFRFSTKFYQAAFGIYDYGRRYLLPKHGRWCSTDPLGEEEAPNLYRFVDNEPIGSVDLIGLSVIPSPRGAYSRRGSQSKVVSWIAPLGNYQALADDIIARYESTTGKTISIDRYKKIEFALEEIDRSANPAPPNAFPTNAAWNAFVTSKEYRGYLYFRPFITCDCNNRALYLGLIESGVSHGYTPIRRFRNQMPAMRYDPGQGTNIRTVTTVNNGSCIRYEWEHRFRVGGFGQALSALLVGVGVPWAWHKIDHTICCNGSEQIVFSGSKFPSHTSYVNNVARGGRPQTDLVDFLFAGFGVPAPGAQFDPLP